MTIDLNSETERIVREVLKTGRFRSVDDLILATVQAWWERNGEQAHARSHGEDKAREFVEWANSHDAAPPLSEEAISRASLTPDRW